MIGGQEAGRREGSEAEAVEECYLPPHSSWLTQPSFLNSSGPPAWGVTVYSVLGPISITDQEKVPHTYL